VARLVEVPIGPRSPRIFERVLSEARVESFLEQGETLREHLHGRVVWNVNSTAAGGGVVELLRPLCAYTRGFGIDTRWVVIQAPREFFLATKRLHHALHGSPDGPMSLDSSVRTLYESVLHENALELSALVRPDDIVLLHDPQTAGLIPHLARGGARVVWRCHIGADEPNEHTEEGWRFLEPYLEAAHAFVFTRREYAPPICDPSRIETIPPTIDPFSPKNQWLSEETIRGILVHTGIIDGPPGSSRREFTREDGSPGRVDRSADVLRLGPAPEWDTPLVVQVSRWDPLKDPLGVLRGFAELVDGRAPAGAELILAGPNVHAVVDDPEGPAVFDEVIEVWRALPHAERRHIHLVNLPMTDGEENAAIVNALQQHAAVVIQKSLKEGFGLTVAEAMWKGRAVIASAVGGIQDQIEDGKSGLLLRDPMDLDGLGTAIERTLVEEGLAARLGDAARERVRENFLGLNSLENWGNLIARLENLG
jgi:trehalose synthase